MQHRNEYIQVYNKVIIIKLLSILGHGPVVEDPKQKILEYIKNRNRREEEILRIISSDGPATTMQITNIIYKVLTFQEISLTIFEFFEPILGFLLNFSPLLTIFVFFLNFLLIFSVLKIFFKRGNFFKKFFLNLHMNFNVIKWSLFFFVTKLLFFRTILDFLFI
jgi:hypothetical protein